MASSLFTALSGLQAHQGWIDVIGNNLANTNTPGYKTSQATFSDQLSQTLRFASGPGTGTGGRNPMQIGKGVRLSDIGRNFSQGPLQSTGRVFDLALEGRGFFVVNDGASNYYSRVGTFGLDALQNLVDVRTGYRVVGTDNQPIQVDTTSLFPPQATGALTLKGNLPAQVTGPLPELLSASTALAHGAPAQATGTNAGPFAVPIGETWSLEIQVNGGPLQTAAVTSTTGSITTADIANALDALDGVSATVDGSGFVQVTSDRKGQSVTIDIDAGPAGRDLASAAGLPTVTVTGSQTALLPTTTLNDLPGNLVPYVAGDVIEVSGVDTDGTPINAQFVYGAANDGETVDDFIAFLDGLYADATVSVTADGLIEVEAQTAGESDLTLSIGDAAGATGETMWSTYALSVASEGTGPDEHDMAMEVYDQAGIAHTLNLTFQRQQDGTWNVLPSIPAGEGSISSGPITGLTFNPDGSPTGLNNVDLDIVVTFSGQPTQTVALDLGSDGGLDHVTQFGGDGTVYGFEQDGWAVGELSNLNVDVDGSIVGSYTNGQSRSLGQLGVAVFSNQEGLRHAGNNLFAETVNSGGRIFGAGATGPAGSIIGGSLESSNVDTAEQFVRLIEAQRGFQTNARVITTQDELLQEMVNLL
jgi:flagellar hook protein FlgE